jgi:AAA domain/Bifunctional DNA primase/polymerase, N-terminal
MTDITAAACNRAEQLTELLHRAPTNTDHEGVRAHVHDLAEAGLAVMFIRPDSKAPAETRTSRERSAADKVAQAEAKAAGNRNWHRVKSPAGLTLATADAGTLDTYLTNYLATRSDDVGVNLAVETGESRLVVVDADTPEEVAAFLADSGPDEVATVSTPGQRSATGELVHHGGGHWYYVVPEGVELPSGSGTAKLDTGSGYSVMWNRRYVLIPPSTRTEGAYKATGDVRPLPGWLFDKITAEAGKRAERATQRQRDVASGDDKVEQWGAGVTWAEILSGTDWINTGKPASCGCDIWTAPGDHASDKSATAHEPGCGRMDSPDPGLNIWTDHDVEPFDAVVAEHGTYLTRLRAYAAIHDDNDLGVAMTALDLHDDDDLSFDPGSVGDSGGNECQGDGQRSGSKRGLRITWASEIEPEPVVWLWVDIAAQNTWHPDAPPGATPDPFNVENIACVAERRTWTPPEVETNGRIACGMVSIAAGREGSGKSSFGIWLAAMITRGMLPGAHYGTPKRVYYLATEDSWKHTLVPRLIAAGADLTRIARVEVEVTEGTAVTISLPDDVDLLTESIHANDVALVVIDPLMSTLGDGLDANASRDVRKALEPLAAMAERTGAAVLGIAHFNKATGMDSLSRISASGAFKDIARAVMVFADGGDERVFTQPKNSVGRTDLPSLVYAIHGAVVHTPKGKTSTAKFSFTGLADRTVDDMLADERGRKRRKSAVAEFLIGYITEHADENGEVAAADVFAAGEAEGFNRKQISNARERSHDPKVGTRKEGFGQGASYFWRFEA